MFRNRLRGGAIWRFSDRTAQSLCTENVGTVSPIREHKRVNIAGQVAREPRIGTSKSLFGVVAGDHATGEGAQFRTFLRA